MTAAGRRRGLCSGGALALMALIAAAPPVGAAPYRPQDDAQPIERLPTAGNPAARELRRLHAELARAPQDLALALRVAKADIGEARAQSDPRYNGYAEAALRPWLQLPTPPVDVLVLRATLRQSTHDFAGALADLGQALSADPLNAQARLTRAIILEVQGAYAEALGNCLALTRLAETLVTATCVASVQSLHGQAVSAYAELLSALDRSAAASGPVRLWALTVLAETAVRRGDGAAAERHFRQALSLGLRDGYLLGAYADFLLDVCRPEDVRALLGDEVRVDPLLLRLALAERRLGAVELPRHVADLGARFAANRLRGDTSHQREEARFSLSLADEPRAALRLAEANWAVQKEPWDARLLLEAALAAEQPSAARAVLDWLAAARLEDVLLDALATRVAAAAR
jgi:hypothetical protein